MNITEYKIGQLVVSLAGDDPVLPRLRDEFSPVMCRATDEGPHLSFSFAQELPTLRDWVSYPPLRVASDAYRVLAQSGLSYQVAPTPRGAEVVIHSLPPRRKQRVLPDWVLRWNDWNYLTPAENTAKNFMYTVFDHLSQIVQLKLGQTYLHASGFSRAGRTIALAAWGGIGKTSSMLQFVLEDSWQFLSDDLLVVDRAGRAWRTPKKLQVYAYNLEGHPHLTASLLGGRSLLDRSAWQYHRRLRGTHGVRRRISAEALLGRNRTAVSAMLTDIVLLERADSEQFVSARMPVEELARRATSTVMKEMQPFLDLATAMHSGDMHPLLPNIESLRLETYETLLAALAHLEPWRVAIPMNAVPETVTDYLRRMLEL